MYMVMVACDMSFSNLSANAYMFLKYPRPHILLSVFEGKDTSCFYV
jgi:hypothetical protein